jgi:cyclophilin family peptidyl-prolyl cis-trans isomerase/HEAT repeat protein
MTKHLSKIQRACRFAALFFVTLTCLCATRVAAQSSIRQETLLKIIQTEDERRWGPELKELLGNNNAAVRSRAALAAGRIGDEDAVRSLADLLAKESNQNVLESAVFAMGELESLNAADPLVAVLKESSEPASLRARAVEALGKIAGSLGDDQNQRRQDLNAVILDVLKAEASRGANGDKEIILLGLTAALRSRVANAGPTIAGFLAHSNPRVRADAANALARLRLKDGATKLQQLLANDQDPIVRANAARALGAAESKEAFDALLDRSDNDADSRVRVSAIRALANLKDPRATESLLKRGKSLSSVDLQKKPTETNEVLEIVTTLGRLLQASDNQEALSWLKQVREGVGNQAPEVEIAFARISPSGYLQAIGWDITAYSKGSKTVLEHWRARSNAAQALGEIANAPNTLPNRTAVITQAEALVLKLLATNDAQVTANPKSQQAAFSVPETLRAFAAFKTPNVADTARKHLTFNDVIIRATAAELLGDLPPEATNEKVLIDSLPRALTDDLNDAALSILDSLGKQKTATANDGVKKGLEASDHLVRRRAVDLLKANGAGDFSERIGMVQTRNSLADYKRAVARLNKTTRATVSTSKGSFVIEFLTEDAPLTVDNFVRLAQKGYFNGQTIPRVVPNFVVQAGDPRGDQNGGPGYSIRCEINEVPYDRAAVGMALSGKDTGGSQWFVTHSPQPHLDGGYTVFGRVVSGMEIVDRIVRGDTIVSVTISERPTTRTMSKNQTQ